MLLHGDGRHASNDACHSDQTQGTRHSPGFHLPLRRWAFAFASLSFSFSRRGLETHVLEETMEDDAFHDASTRFGESCRVREKKHFPGCSPGPICCSKCVCFWRTASNGLPLTSLSSSETRLPHPIDASFAFRSIRTPDELSLEHALGLVGRAPSHPVKGKTAEPTEDAFILRTTFVSNTSPVSRGTLAVSSRTRRFRVFRAA